LQAGKKVGLSDPEIESFLQQIKEEPIKAKLKETTQQAIDFGVCTLTALLLLAIISLFCFFHCMVVCVLCTLCISFCLLCSVCAQVVSFR